MNITIIATDKVGKKEFRLVKFEDYIYHDEIGGDVKTDKAPTYVGTKICIQEHCRFRWIKYWDTLKTYKCNKYKSRTINIQIVNGRKFLNKILNYYRYGKV